MTPKDLYRRLTETFLERAMDAVVGAQEAAPAGKAKSAGAPLAVAIARAAGALSAYAAMLGDACGISDADLKTCMEAGRVQVEIREGREIRARIAAAQQTTDTMPTIVDGGGDKPSSCSN